MINFRILRIIQVQIYRVYDDFKIIQIYISILEFYNLLKLPVFNK